MSTAVQIKVNLDCGCCMSFTDQNGKDGRQKTSHRADGDTYSWSSDFGDLVVEFPHGHEFETGPKYSAAQGQWTAPVKVAQTAPKGKKCYKYTVTVTPKGGQPCVEDPQVIIDDGLLLTDGGASAAADVGDAAQKVLTTLFGQLNSGAGTKTDPGRLFFPQGIELILLTVNVGNAASVTIEVAGPKDQVDPPKPKLDVGLP